MYLNKEMISAQLFLSPPSVRPVMVQVRILFSLGRNLQLNKKITSNNNEQKRRIFIRLYGCACISPKGWSGPLQMVMSSEKIKDKS